MPLFYESSESIAQAIVTVERALKHGVIEEEKYKRLKEYLNKRATDLNINKERFARANRNLDGALEMAVEELYMDECDELYKMAEELLEEFEDKEPEEPDARVAASKAWLKMNDEERAAMAELAIAWKASE